MNKLYIQHQGKVIKTDSNFSHVMAIALDPRTSYKQGVVRCITSRQGDVTVSGYIDRSEIHKVKMLDSESFEIAEKIQIKNEDKIIKSLLSEDLDFIGLEDPDIYIDEQTDLLHLYFTLPLINSKNHHKNRIHIGHAFGKDLDSLTMTEPILLADDIGGAKELCIVPINSNGFRYNLVESSKKEKDFTYSVVRIAITENMSEKWKFGDIIFHPKEANIPWIADSRSRLTRPAFF